VPNNQGLADEQCWARCALPNLHRILVQLHRSGAVHGQLEINMFTKTAPYNPFDYLQMDEEITQYLNDAYMNNDPEVFKTALDYFFWQLRKYTHIFSM
jgi:hypothetical protein